MLLLHPDSSKGTDPTPRLLGVPVEWAAGAGGGGGAVLGGDRASVLHDAQHQKPSVAECQSEMILLNHLF